MSFSLIPIGIDYSYYYYLEKLLKQWTSMIEMCVDQHTYEIALREESTTDDFCNILPAEDRFVELSFGVTDITDTGLKKLFSVQRNRLRRLWFDENELLQGTGWQGLENCPQLEEIFLESTNQVVFEPASKALQHCPQLRELRYTGKVTDQDLLPLAIHSKLQVLSLWHGTFNKGMAEVINSLPSLKDVYITDNSELNAEFYKTLNNRCRMEKLWLEKTFIDQKCALQLFSLPAMQALRVESYPIAEDLLEVFCQCDREIKLQFKDTNTNIRGRCLANRSFASQISLELNEVKVQPEFFDNLVKCHYIKELELRNIEGIKTKDILKLKSTTIQSLDVNNCGEEIERNEDKIRSTFAHLKRVYL